MGIHISLLDENREEVPEWDYTRYGGDRQFYYTEDFKWDYLDAKDETRPKRPTDIEKARAWLRENDFDSERLMGLLDMLEAHPLWGIEAQ